MKRIWSNIKWFFRRLKRVWDFLPIIWKGYDFDYSHAIDLFKYQLERTADLLESDKAYTLNAKLHAQKIRTAVRLIDKVYNEEYLDGVTSHKEFKKIRLRESFGNLFHIISDIGGIRFGYMKLMLYICKSSLIFKKLGWWNR